MQGKGGEAPRGGHTGGRRGGRPQGAPSTEGCRCGYGLRGGDVGVAGICHWILEGGSLDNAKFGLYPARAVI